MAEIPQAGGDARDRTGLTDEQLKETLRLALFEAWLAHKTDQPKRPQDGTSGLFFSAERAAEVLVPTVRRLLAEAGPTWQPIESLPVMNPGNRRVLLHCPDSTEVVQSCTIQNALRLVAAGANIAHWAESPVPPESKHHWVTRRAGGDPSEASSYERVSYCAECGVERSDETANARCPWTAPPERAEPDQEKD